MCSNFIRKVLCDILHWHNWTWSVGFGYFRFNKNGIVCVRCGERHLFPPPPPKEMANGTFN